MAAAGTQTRTPLSQSTAAPAPHNRLVLSGAKFKPALNSLARPLQLSPIPNTQTRAMGYCSGERISSALSKPPRFTGGRYYWACLCRYRPFANGGGCNFTIKNHRSPSSPAARLIKSPLSTPSPSQSFPSLITLPQHLSNPGPLGLKRSVCQFSSKSRPRSEELPEVVSSAIPARSSSSSQKAPAPSLNGLDTTPQPHTPFSTTTEKLSPTKNNGRGRAAPGPCGHRDARRRP